MISKRWRVAAAGVAVLAAFAGGYAVAQSGKTVSVGGRTASKDVQELNGRVYVSLTDIATAFNRTVMRSGDRYDLVPTGTGSPLETKPEPGNTVSVNALTGAVGETLKASQSSLTVLQVIQGAKYTSAITGKTFDAKADAKIVAVVCRFKNGLKKTRRYDLGRFKAGATALVGTDGKTYIPGDWDRKDAIAAVSALGTVDFAVVFYLPANAAPQEFVYQVRPNDFDSTMREDIFRVQFEQAKPEGSLGVP